MRIVVLDGYTLNPGDLRWRELEELGECAIYDRTPPDQVVSRARDFEIVLVNKVELSRQVLAALPRLRYVGVLAVEPPPRDHPLLRAKNCYVTPHVAWATKAARQRLLAAVVDNIRAFLAGQPKNVVNC